jgi:hypothetical protein
MPPNLPYSLAQKAFIDKTRNLIDGDDSFFDCHDWRCIQPPGGRNSSLRKAVDTDSFYVKALAVWLPERLIPGHVPTCPHCGSSQFVDIHRARWINMPKVLYGLALHSYLDTKLYPCSSCNKRFCGYDSTSIGYDTDKIVGYFNIRIADRFAVDETLFSFLVASCDRPTTAIYAVLEEMATERYLNDYALFLHAVRAKKVKEKLRGVSDRDDYQLTLDTMLEQRRQLTAHQRLHKSLQGQLQTQRLSLHAAEGKLNDPIDFSKLLKTKQGRNERGLALPGIGDKKFQELTEEGVTTGRKLVDYVGIPSRWRKKRDHPAMFEGWRTKAKVVFRERQKKVNEIKASIKDLEEQVAAVEGHLELETAIDIELEADDEQVLGTTIAEEMLPKFSGIYDRSGYNCRVLKAGRIEQLLMTDFLHRKPMQQSKMLGLPCEILKIDCNEIVRSRID